MSKLNSFIISILMFTTLQSANAVTFRCQPEALRRSQHSVFYNSKNGSLWISASDDSANVFSALGFVQLTSAKQIPVKVKNRMPMNSYSCPLKPTFLKTYQGKMFSLFVGNTCAETLAKNLGFALQPKPQNYGSMEGGYPLPWSTVGLCTDGKTLYHCGQPTKEMQACIKASEKLLLQ